MRKLLRKTAFLLQGVLLLHLFWWLASALLNMRAVPSPLTVYAQLDRLWQNQIQWHVLYSLCRIVAGVALALLAGVPLGLLMARFPRWNRLLYPVVYLSYPIPKTALLPVAMLLWGMRDGSKIAILFLIVVFQVIVAVRDSALAVEPDWYRVIASAGATPAQLLRHVTLPAVMPGLLSSLRVSIGTGVAVLFFVEGYGTRYGVGYYILDAWSRMHYVDMYSGILLISALGFALFAGVDVLSRRLCAWSGSAGLE